MALAVTVNVSMIDAKGKTSVTKIRVPSGFVLSQYAEFAQGIGQIICDMTDGAITAISVSVPVSLSGATIRGTALGIADIAKKLLVMARSSVTGLVGKFFIPTYDEDNSVSGSDQADTSDTEVAAFISIVEGGINVSGTVIAPIDMRGNDLVEVSEAREIFRKFG